MDRRAFLATAGAAAIGAVAPHAWAQTATKAPAGGAEDVKLRAMLDRFFEEQVDESPQQATQLGLDKGARAAMKSKLDDRSLAERAKDVHRTRMRLAELKTIDRNALSEPSKVDYDVVAYR